MSFRCPAVLLPLALLVLPVVAGAQSHAPLLHSATLDFQTMLDSALAQTPETREAGVRQRQADAYVAAGDSWIAGRPGLALDLYDDRLLDNRGQVEASYGVQLPLWRPGERRDSRQLGRDYREQVALWHEALTLDVAGRLRSSLAAMEEASALLQIERDSTATAEELLRVTSAQFEAGAVARIEVMQVDNLLLEQRKRELAAEAALVDAEIGYALLTGLQERPAASLVETLTTQTEVPEQHPLLRYLQSEVAIADGAITQEEIAARGSPQLQIGTRRERGDRFSPYIESLNLSLTVPFGGRSWVDSRTSAAHRDKVDAEVRYFSTRRALQQALHEVEHELATTAAAIPLAQRQTDLGAERQQLAQAAFGAGELSLAQVLPAVQEARSAARELALLQLRQQRLIAEFNQLVGVLP